RAGAVSYRRSPTRVKRVRAPRWQPSGNRGRTGSRPSPVVGQSSEGGPDVPARLGAVGEQGAPVEKLGKLRGIVTSSSRSRVSCWSAPYSSATSSAMWAADLLYGQARPVPPPRCWLGPAVVASGCRATAVDDALLPHSVLFTFVGSADTR